MYGETVHAKACVACRTYIEHDPLRNCARSLGFLFLQAGDRARAREELSLLLGQDR